mgnify:CR=1 FL=1
MQSEVGGVDVETLSVNEYANIKGCTPRNIRKLITKGKIKAIPTINQKNKKVFQIPFDFLNDEEQAKYYESKGIIKSEIKVSSTEALEDMTPEEREECIFWEKVVKEWQLYRSKEGVKSKEDVDNLFITKMKLEYPSIDISYDILRRKYIALKNEDLKGLIDKRGKAKKGYSKINNEVIRVYLSFYLDQANHSQKKCYEYTKDFLRGEGKDELVDSIPSYTTFTRYIKNKIPDGLIILGRYGEKAFDDKCAPYIVRSYDDMESNDYWIGDNHTIDVLIGDTGNQFKLYLTAFMDARSGVITCVYLTDNPSSQASIYSLRRGIIKYGIPKNVYLDNGREFLTFDFGGRGHRAKKNDDRYAPPPILERLGINMVNAIVRNAKAKTIERRFLDFKNNISKLFTTYIGGNVIERPEILKVELKNGNIPDRETFIKQIEDLIEYYLNYEPYNGSVAKDRGKRKIDVYKENLHTKIMATDEDLSLMMLRSTRTQKVTRNGVHLNIKGAKINYRNNDLVMQCLNKEVYLRYDPDDLSKVRIYDLDDRFIIEAERITPLPYGASQEDVKKAMAETRSVKKATKQVLKHSVIEGIDRNTALELILKKVEENKKTDVADAGLKDIVVKSADETPLLYQMPVIDLEKMNKNSLIRKGGYENVNNS